MQNETGFPESNTSEAETPEAKDNFYSRLGSHLSMVGALLVSLNLGVGVVGYLLMTFSASLLGYWAFKSGIKSQAQMYGLFIVINVVGLFRHFG